MIGDWFYTNQDRNIDAVIDEVRIWNIARTESEINNNISSELSLPQTGLVAYYKFNQGISGGNNSTETNLTDETGDNNGTLSDFALNGTNSNWVTESTVSIPNINWLNKIKIFPIPTSEFIQLSGLTVKENYTIYNVLGSEAKKGYISNQETIDVREFTNGIYFLKFENGNTIKFIKE